MGILQSTGKLLNDPSRFATPAVALPSEDLLQGDGPVKSYDYIIVGGGTAGCVLASRLSENPNVTVLLIEAGPGHKGNILSSMPMAASMLWHGPNDWDFHTTPQMQLEGRRIHWPRGKILGGSSAINYMVYHHCDPADFDAWETLGAKGWGYESLKKYFIKSECHQPNSPDHTIDMSQHGQTGPLVTRQPERAPIHEAVLQAAANMGFPNTHDFNTSEGTLGSGFFFGCVDERNERHSTASAYLTDEILARPNLTVAVSIFTEKIIFKTTNGDEPKAIGVQICQEKEGSKFVVRVNKEILLSAGALGSPHLLLLSGIGPSTQLSAFGIPIVRELPQVGEHLLDHFLPGGINFRAKRGCSWDPHFYETLPSLLAFLRYRIWGTGPMSSLPVPTAVFFRSDDPRVASMSSLPVEDMSSGPRAPDMELAFSSLTDAGHGKKPSPRTQGVASGCCLLKPQSKGTVRLRSASVFDHPEIDPNYLSTESDWNMAIKLNRMLLRLGHTPPLSDCFDLPASDAPLDDLYWPADADPDKLTDEEMRTFIRKHGRTAWHPTSTARIGTSPENSVVDSNLCVHGVRGLRVVDASVFPDQVSGHPCAVVVAIAERASDLIRGSTT